MNAQVAVFPCTVDCSAAGPETEGDAHLLWPLWLFPSATREGLQQLTGWSSEDLQLPSGNWDSVWPHTHYPRHPADLPWFKAPPWWSVLSAHQANQPHATSQQYWEPAPLAADDLYELHFPAQQRDPALPQVPPPKVNVSSLCSLFPFTLLIFHCLL